MEEIVHIYTDRGEKIGTIDSNSTIQDLRHFIRRHYGRRTRNIIDTETGVNLLVLDQDLLINYLEVEGRITLTIERKTFRYRINSPDYYEYQNILEKEELACQFFQNEC